MTAPYRQKTNSSQFPVAKKPKRLSVWGVRSASRGQGQGAWVVLTGRCGCLRGVERLGAGLTAVAVNAVALIRELARIDILTIRGRLGRVHIALRLPALG